MENWSRSGLSLQTTDYVTRTHWCLHSSRLHMPLHGFPPDIATGGGADGEGGASPLPCLYPVRLFLRPPPRPASGLLPRPKGRGQCVAIGDGSLRN